MNNTSLLAVIVILVLGIFAVLSINTQHSSAELFDFGPPVSADESLNSKSALNSSTSQDN